MKRKVLNTKSMIFSGKEKANNLFRPGKSIHKDNTEPPIKDEELIQCFQGIIDPNQTTKCFNLIYHYSKMFFFP